MRLAIYGTGGVGGYLGGRLAQGGADVIFIARGEHYRAIVEHGLIVESMDGDFTIRPATAVEEAAKAGQVDAVIVATKAWQVDDAAAKIGPLLGARTFILPLENGVDSVERLIAKFGPER